MNMKIILAFTSFFLLSAFVQHDSSIYSTNTANINFFSHTDVEDIAAENHKVKAAFDAKSGKIQFSLLVKDFAFEKALMQEHFNENYMESDEYPKATFNGTIDQIDKVKVGTDGTYKSTVTGKLSMKGVTKTVTSPAVFVVANGVVNATTDFIVKPEDYNIKIPRVVRSKIAKEIKVSVDADFKHKH